jgi:hypothetical protein
VNPNESGVTTFDVFGQHGQTGFVLEELSQHFWHQNMEQLEQNFPPMHCGVSKHRMHVGVVSFNKNPTITAPSSSFTSFPEHILFLEDSDNTRLIFSIDDMFSRSNVLHR